MNLCVVISNVRVFPFEVSGWRPMDGYLRRAKAGDGKFIVLI